ncbi:hypothetical protein [Cognaticolwellia mytili]|uniref:hypothetical protein n=1 Tax=Cognaticolwellia mytili TaxID=1888913 RepID=UPI000A171F60|nr:hypothetical protein [Cognaticolwellia mytili]
MKIISFILLLFYSLNASSIEIKVDSKIAIISSVNIVALNERQIRNLFSLKKKLLPNNTRAVLVRLPFSHDVSKIFCQNIYELYPYQLQRQWDRLVFSGKATAPKQANSESEVIKLVASYPNALGYISANSPLLTEYKGQINVVAVY